MDATAVRWRRYGKDRLYVNGADGARIGWRDLVTGEDHLDDREATELYSATVDTWVAHAGDSAATIDAQLGGKAPAALAERTVEADVAANVTCSEAEPGMAEDLADRRPGAAARAEAMRLKDERSVLTFVARVLAVHTDERAWRIGADGEEKVAARLAKLGKADPRWCGRRCRYRGDWGCRSRRRRRRRYQGAPSGRGGRKPDAARQVAHLPTRGA